VPDDEGYWALRNDRAAVLLTRDFVRVSGPDAGTFLQGQLSQDVDAVPVGSHAWSWLLQPTGKVVALLRVWKLSPEELILDTDPGWGDAVVTRLERFRLRVRASVEPAGGLRLVTVRGPAAEDRHPLPGLPGYDLLGEAVGPPPGVVVAAPDAWESVRVEAGIPRMGAELGDDTIPAEAGRWWIDHAVSFTKGCYTGQELVARVDSRGGHVPRRLVGVVVPEAVLPPAGATVRLPDGPEVGRLTSVAESPLRRAPVALGLLHRRAEVPGEVVVVWEGGEVVSRAEPLPLVSCGS
jgi:folate-binding protein YgfZ